MPVVPTVTKSFLVKLNFSLACNNLSAIWVFELPLTPKFINTRSEYERTLKQRNTLLKSLGRRPPSQQAQDTLDAWDEQLIINGSNLVSTRLINLKKLTPKIIEFGKTISGNTEPLEVDYLSSWLPKDTFEIAEIENVFRENLKLKFKDELDPGYQYIANYHHF